MESNQSRTRTQYIYSKSLTIQIVNKKLSIIEINTICKAIIVHGQLQGSSIGLRLSQFALNSIILTPIQRDVIIGILLGDGHIKL